MRGDALVSVDLNPAATAMMPARTAAARKAASAIERYFQNPGKAPSLKLETGGTPFQRRVWRALKAIPFGSTLTYGALARKLGTSARAVGGACRDNPVPIVVPCHRVVAAGGAGGFMGHTRRHALSIKSWLLRHECRVPSGESDQAL